MADISDISDFSCGEESKPVVKTKRTRAKAKQRTTTHPAATVTDSLDCDDLDRSRSKPSESLSVLDSKPKRQSTRDITASDKRRTSRKQRQSQDVVRLDSVQDFDDNNEQPTATVTKRTAKSKRTRAKQEIAKTTGEELIVMESSSHVKMGIDNVSFDHGDDLTMEECDGATVSSVQVKPPRTGTRQHLRRSKLNEDTTIEKEIQDKGSSSYQTADKPKRKTLLEAREGGNQSEDKIRRRRKKKQLLEDSGNISDVNTKYNSLPRSGPQNNNDLKLQVNDMKEQQYHSLDRDSKHLYKADKEADTSPKESTSKLERESTRFRASDEIARVSDRYVRTKKVRRQVEKTDLATEFASQYSGSSKAAEDVDSELEDLSGIISASVPDSPFTKPSRHQIVNSKPKNYEKLKSNHNGYIMYKVPDKHNLVESESEEDERVMEKLVKNKQGKKINSEMRGKENGYSDDVEVVVEVPVEEKPYRKRRSRGVHKPEAVKKDGWTTNIQDDMAWNGSSYDCETTPEHCIHVNPADLESGYDIVHAFDEHVSEYDNKNGGRLANKENYSEVTDSRRKPNKNVLGSPPDSSDLASSYPAHVSQPSLTSNERKKKKVPTATLR